MTPVASCVPLYVYKQRDYSKIANIIRRNREKTPRDVLASLDIVLRSCYIIFSEAKGA